jgi:phosphoesterase RecJ-like protein
MTDAHSSDLRAVADALLGARSVVVCAHVNPDGDAVGAVLGITLALRAAGIDAIPTLADARSAPVLYAFLPGFSLYRSVTELAPPDVFLAIDVPVLARLGDAQKLARSAGSIVVIDHHPDNATFGAVNYVDADAAAVGQMVWRMLPALDVAPDPSIATCLFVAVMTDTGRFSYGNTNAAVMRDAADMLDAGASAYRSYASVYETRSPAHLRLLGLTLSRIAHANDGRVAYSWITSEDLVKTGALPEETEDLIDTVRAVEQVDAVLMLKCVDGECRLSLRAKGGFDVGAVATKLGGGGHHAAAGATVCGTMDEALAAVLPLLPGGARS